MKSEERRGRLSTEQREYRALCQAAAIAHVTGTYDDLIAWLIEHQYARPEQFPTYRRPKVSL